MLIRTGLTLAVLTAAFMPLIINYLNPSNAAATSQLAYNYTKTFNTSNGLAQGSAVATDSSGDVFVVGYFSGTVIFNPADVTTSVTSANDSAFVTKFNSNGSYVWTRTFDTSSGTAQASGVSINSSGDIFVTGGFSGTVVFNPSDNTTSVTSNNSDSFITEFNAAGSYNSTQTFDASSGYSGATGISTDSSGDIYVTGWFTQTITFNPSDSSTSVTTSNNTIDSFLTKYNSSGGYLWTQTFDVVTTNGQAQSTAIAIDNSGAIYIAGFFQDTVIFNPNDSSTSVTAGVGNQNLGDFITKYNPNGTYDFTTTVDVGGYYNHPSVAIDSNNDVYLADSFTGTVASNPNDPSTSIITPDRNGDREEHGGFINKYNSSGSFDWSQTINENQGGYIPSTNLDGISIDANGNVYVVGTFNNDGAYVGNDADQGFLSELSPDGTIDLTKPSGGNSPAAITVDGNNNIFIAGSFDGSITFDGPGGSDTQTAGGSGGAFLTNFTSPTSKISVSGVGDGSITALTPSSSSLVQPIVSSNSDTSAMNAVACPTSTTCFAIGSADNQAESSANDLSMATYSGGSWSWTLAQIISGLGELNSIACPSSTTCVAVGDIGGRGDSNDIAIATIGTLSGGVWTWTAENLVNSDSSLYGELDSISCPSSTTCLAVGVDGNSHGIFTVGTLSGGVWTWADETTVNSAPSFFFSSLNAISCPTSTDCVAVGQGGLNQGYTIATDATLSGGVWTWATETQLVPDSSNWGILNSVSCPDSTTCIAVGQDETVNSQGITTVGNTIRWSLDLDR